MSGIAHSSARARRADPIGVRHAADHRQAGAKPDRVVIVMITSAELDDLFLHAMAFDTTAVDSDMTWQAAWQSRFQQRYLYERMGFALIFKLPAHLGLRYWLFR
jgi:hypothetical protein